MAENKINLNNLDKSDWQSYRFDEIAKNISERVDPNNTDLEVYIGLEHIDSESLHIKRFGTPDDVNGQKLKFYKDDIIFGRRRAYQRKAGIANCDGFCSAHSLVLRANPEVIDPDLFPFFMHSDLFMNRAVDISVGSLSPTINWGTLKHQEFLIPPKYIQGQFSDLLWKMNKLIRKEEELLSSVEYGERVYLQKAFTKGAYLNQESKDSAYGQIPSNWSLKRLGELGEFKNGFNKDKSKFGYGKPFVNLLDVFGSKELYKKDFDLVDVTAKEVESYNLLEGDVLFVRSSVKPSGVGLTVLLQENLPDTVYAGFIIRFRPFSSEIMSHTYKKYCFYEERFRYSLCRRSTVSANTNINQESLNKLYIPIPPIDEEEEFSRRMVQFEGLMADVRNKIQTSKSLQNRLLSQVF